MDEYHQTTITTIFELIRKVGRKVDLLTIEQLFEQHPLPHSMRAISDTLDKLKIENIVCHITKEQLNTVPIPFVVFIRNTPALFYIFKGFKKERIHLQAGTTSFCLSQADFYEVWTGEILILNIPQQQTTHAYVVKYWFKQTIWLLLHYRQWVILFLSIGLLLYYLVHNSHIPDNYHLLIILLLHCMGLTLSIIILQKTYWHPKTLKNICIHHNIDTCNNTIHSTGAYLWNIFSLSELSTAYFLSLIIWGVFFTNNPFPIWALCSIITLGVVIYSLIWQIKKSQYCYLCIALDVLLITEAIYLYIIPINTDFSLFSLLTFGSCFILLLVSLNWLCIHSQKETNNVRLTNKYEQLLSNPYIFPYLLSLQPIIPSHDDIATINNNIKNYDHCVTVIINLRCQHCSTILDLISHIPNCRIEYILISNKEDTEAFQAALQIVSMSKQQYSWDMLLSVMQSWYRQGHIFPLASIHIQAESILQSYNDFCLNRGLTATPTILIDNRIIPELYDGQDLEFIL